MVLEADAFYIFSNFITFIRQNGTSDNCRKALAKTYRARV